MGSLLGSWSMTALHVKGKFLKESLALCSEAGSPALPSPALPNSAPNRQGPGRSSPSVTLPQFLPFPAIPPLWKLMALSSRCCNLTTHCIIIVEGPLYSLYYIWFVFCLCYFLHVILLLPSWCVSFFKTGIIPHISPLCSLVSNPSLRMPKIKLHMWTEKHHLLKGKCSAP